MSDEVMSSLPRQPEPYAGRGRVLRVKEGFNPNSSSLGSVIFSIPAALVAAPVFLAGAAAFLAARMARKDAAGAAPAAPSAESAETREKKS